MSDIVVKVENLSKQYCIGQAAHLKWRTFGEALNDVAAAPFRRLVSTIRHTDLDAPARARSEIIWALKDVSFEVEQGDVVGIIGRNGAGKSTLLKILSRITEPTAGRILIHGRMACLLEVGTGFHSDLTGRENVYLNGAILGMRKADIDRKFDEIVAFAEVEKFIDTPVKRYSSGMTVRLAFAVAAHLDPEILLVDEVLAVGDIEFQKRCVEKMGRIVRSGATIFLVSHNLAILNELSRMIIWLDKGSLRESGPPQAIINSYVASTSAGGGEWHADEAPENLPACLNRIRVMQGQDTPTENVLIDQQFEVEISYTIRQPMPFCRVGLLVSNAMNLIIFSTAETDDTAFSPFDRAPGKYVSRCRVPGWLLAAGTYFLTPHIDHAPLHCLYSADRACTVTMVENVLRSASHPNRPGVIVPKLKWESATHSG